MGWLPNMVYADRIRKQTQIKFGGYDHRIGAEDGSVWDEKNIRYCQENGIELM